MREHLLQFIWNYQLHLHDLKTVSGQKVRVIKAGTQNFDSGPDFLDSRIKIDDTLWAGHVELHLKTSDWIHHKHHLDEQYSNVVLHVVFQHDKDISSIATIIPTLELKDYISNTLIEKYKYLMQSQKWIACEDYVSKIDSFKGQNFLTQVLIERLERKSIEIEELYQKFQNDWDKTFFVLLSMYLGGIVNKESFRAFSSSVDLQYLYSNKDKVFTIEAILFGQAQMLQQKDSDNQYYNTLQQEFQFHLIKKKWQENSSLQWKFMRMHPAGFPTIRIAQLAALISKHGSISQKVLNISSNKDFLKLLDVVPSKFWNEHYHFGTESKSRKKRIGNSMKLNVLINVIAPFLFAYGRQNLNYDKKDLALDILQSNKAESNRIIRKWNDLGVQANDAFFSQALLELKSNYCDKKLCLNCGIGIEIMKEKR